MSWIIIYYPYTILSLIYLDYYIMKYFILNLLRFIIVAVVLYYYYNSTLEARWFENTVISMLSTIMAYVGIMAFKMMD